MGKRAAAVAPAPAYAPPRKPRKRWWAKVARELVLMLIAEGIAATTLVLLIQPYMVAPAPPAGPAPPTGTAAPPATAVPPVTAAPAPGWREGLKAFTGDLFAAVGATLALLVLVLGVAHLWNMRRFYGGNKTPNAAKIEEALRTALRFPPFHVRTRRLVLALLPTLALFFFAVVAGYMGLGTLSSAIFFVGGVVLFAVVEFLSLRWAFRASGEGDHVFFLALPPFLLIATAEMTRQLVGYVPALSVYVMAAIWVLVMLLANLQVTLTDRITGVVERQLTRVIGNPSPVTLRWLQWGMGTGSLDPVNVVDEVEAGVRAMMQELVRDEGANMARRLYALETDGHSAQRSVWSNMQEFQDAQVVALMKDVDAALARMHLSSRIRLQVRAFAEERAKAEVESFAGRHAGAALMMRDPNGVLLGGKEAGRIAYHWAIGAALASVEAARVASEASASGMSYLLRWFNGLVT
jgi:hypothetical protein